MAWSVERGGRRGASEVCGTLDAERLAKGVEGFERDEGEEEVVKEGWCPGGSGSRAVALHELPMPYGIPIQL